MNDFNEKENALSDGAELDGNENATEAPADGETRKPGELEIDGKVSEKSETESVEVKENSEAETETPEGKEEPSEVETKAPEGEEENSELKTEKATAGAIETELCKEKTAASNGANIENGTTVSDKGIDMYNIDTHNIDTHNGSDKAEAKLKRVWLGITMAITTLLIAFTGAFFGVVYVCRTSIFGDSEFFDAFIAKWAGVTERRVEVDYISGEYKEDTTELAAKTLASTVIVRKGYRNENGSFVQTASGSGVIFSEVSDGVYYVVTNFHVVEGAKSILVEIYSSDGDTPKRFEAEARYLDKSGDIAVLEFECDEELAVATQGDSSKVKAGQRIIVAGNPLGSGFAVSIGYVSNPYREPTSNSCVPIMTLDTTVNPGNSGGGVYDFAGNLIGIIVAKASGEDIDGIGYAIPINDVNVIIDDLLRYGYVKGRGAFGITVTSVYNISRYTELMQGELNGYIFDTDDPHYGVYIINVETPNSLLKKGDRIISVGGSSVTVTDDISEVLISKKPGSVVRVIVERAEKKDDEITYTTVSLDVVLVERKTADTLGN